VTEPRNTAVPPDPGTDWERMALQIEGRLPDGAGYLDGLSDEDLAIFADAAAATRELEAEDAGVLPLRRPARRSPWLDRRWMAAAAVIAAIALVPLATRGMRGGAVRGPSEAVAMLDQPAAGLPAGYDERPWGTTRGGRPTGTDERADNARAARLGAYGVDLELAVRARDAEQTRLLVGRIVSELGEVTGGSSVAGLFTGVAERAGAPPAELLSDVEEANEAAAGFVDGARYALGAWAEAARFAAMRQDAAFFQSARTRRTLAKAEEVLAEDEQARTALTAIRAASGSDAPDWARLQEAVNELLRAIA
jgi:hypothetical protein